MGKQLKLSEYLQSVARKPFIWGEHDCALHCANAVLAMTGKDFGEPFRGKYNSMAGANIELKNCGFNSLEDCFTQALGMPQYRILKAMRGDICQLELGSGTTYGVVDDTGRSIALVHENKGLVRMPLTTAIKFWEVK